MIKQFNSSITLPLVLFLGLDERKKDGFEHGIYKGTPCFAVDVTPKGTVEKEAMGVVEAMKAKGFSFMEGRVHMSLNAPEGMPLPPLYKDVILTGMELPSTPKPVPSSTGTHEIPSVGAAANPHSPSTQAPSGCVLLPTSLIYLLPKQAPNLPKSLMYEPHAQHEKASPTSPSLEPILQSSWLLCRTMRSVCFLGDRRGGLHTGIPR